MLADALSALPHFSPDPRLVRAAAWALVHFLWQGALGAGLLWLGLAGCRSARSRYALSCMALLAMTVAPPVTAWRMMHASPVEAPSASVSSAGSSSAHGHTGREVDTRRVDRTVEAGP